MRIRGNVRPTSAAITLLIGLFVLSALPSAGEMGWGVSPPFHLDTTEPPPCWPYLLSYADFPGIPQYPGGSHLFTLGLYSTSGGTATIGQYTDGCWHVPQQVISLPEDGCGLAGVFVEYNSSPGADCDPLANLSLVAWQGPIAVARARHRVVADHRTLDVTDLGIPGWGDYGNLGGLLQAFAPYIRLNQGERYAPVRVEVSLHGATLRTDSAPYGPPFPPVFQDTELSADDLARYSWSFFSVDLPCSELNPDGCQAAFTTAVNNTTDPYVVYATAIRDRGALFDEPEDDYIVLQYHCNYYFNDNETQFCFLPYAQVRQVHEGDWEHVTVALDLSLNPVGVAFPGHGAYEAMPWESVETFPGTKHPVVYVSRGGHASYRRAGSHCLEKYKTLELHFGDGEQFAPADIPGQGHYYALETLPRWADLPEEGGGNGWIEFAGYWGTGTCYEPTCIGSSVWYGPAFRYSWVSPIGEEFTNVDFCVASPVDIVVRDPWGREAGPDTTTIPAARYEVSTIDSAGVVLHRSAWVRIPYPLAGRYQVEVIPLESALPTDVYSLWTARNWIGSSPDTLYLAEDVQIADIPPEGYEVTPDVPHVGRSLVIPDTWDVDWEPEESNPIEWHLSSPDGSFDVNALLWDSLRLNGAVAPTYVASESTAVGLGLRILFPCGPAVHSIEQAEPNTTRQALLTGMFQDSLRLEARAQILLVSSAVGVPQVDGGLNQFNVTSVPRSALSGEPVLALSLPRAGRLRVDVFDVAGRSVRNLVDDTRAAGHHTVRWNGRSDTGRAVPSGVYFVRATLDWEVRRSTLVVLR